jgi:hypothetical protein
MTVRHYGTVTSDDVAEFLAKRLLATIKRIKRGKPTQRCEAISSDGFQCGSMAEHETDGRFLCQSHFNHPSPLFTANPAPSVEDWVADIVAQISEIRPGVKNAVAKVIK